MMKKYKIVKHMFTKEDKARVILLFIGMLILGLTELVGVASVVPFMSMVTDNTTINSNKYLNFIYVYFGFTHANTFLFFSGIAVIFFITISNSFSIFMNWKIQNFIFMQEQRIATRMLQKYLSQEYIFFLSRNSSELSKNILTEIGRAMSGVILPMLQIISKVIITFMLLALLVATDPILALSICITLGFIYVGLFVMVRKLLHSIGNIVAEAISLRYKILNETFSSIKFLKLKGLEESFIELFRRPAYTYAKYSAMSTVISHAPRYLLEIVAFGGIMGIVIYLISQEQNNSYIISYMALYAFAGYRLMPALQQIYAGLTLVHYNLPAVEAIIEDLQLQNKASQINQQQFKGQIFKRKVELKKVKFKYPGAKSWLLEDINLEIKIDSCVAIIGKTGSGKSTLIDIILNIHMPNEGTFLLDGKELSKSQALQWQRGIGYVPQDIYLADDSILNNIAFMVAEEDVCLERVTSAAKVAHIHDFIMELPDGYNTSIGERGVRLSGGQKQRLGIARAMYYNPDILVLDEATSAMDTLTEDAIIESIRNLKSEKTIIMVAHRLSTIKDCDVIHILERGKVVASGNFNDLASKNKKFQKMLSV